MRGSAEYRRGRWRLDLEQNLGNLISQEIILAALHEFLERRYAGRAGDSVLDLGAGSKPYARLYETRFASCTAVDVPESSYDTSSIDVFAPADELPFDDASFDCVICTEMLEHCPRPHAVMAEIARVLRAGGAAFVTTPFLLPLHDMPYDYYRYTPSALRAMATDAGLTVTSIEPRGGYGAVTLGVVLMPITKVFHKLAAFTRLPLFHPANPLVLATIVLPQRLYLSIWRYGRRHATSRVARLSDRLTNYTLGYLTELEKPTKA